MQSEQTGPASWRRCGLSRKTWRTEKGRENISSWMGTAYKRKDKVGGVGPVEIARPCAKCTSCVTCLIFPISPCYSSHSEDEETESSERFSNLPIITPLISREPEPIPGHSGGRVCSQPPCPGPAVASEHPGGLAAALGKQPQGSHRRPTRPHCSELPSRWSSPGPARKPGALPVPEDVFSGNHSQRMYQQDKTS